MKKPTHGGQRKGAGRKAGKKAFKNTKPNPTTVRRVPNPILERIDEIIDSYYESIGYKKKKCPTPAINELYPLIDIWT
jgi:hypothetical protein